MRCDLIMAKFILEIELGNAAMSNPCDLGKALVGVGEKISKNGEAVYMSAFVPGKIRDINGNVVGKYEVTE